MCHATRLHHILKIGIDNHVNMKLYIMIISVALLACGSVSTFAPSDPSKIEEEEQQVEKKQTTEKDKGDEKGEDPNY